MGMGYISGRMAINMRGSGKPVSDMEMELTSFLMETAMLDSIPTGNLMDLANTSGLMAISTLASSKMASSMGRGSGRRHLMRLMIPQNATVMTGITPMIRKTGGAYSSGKAEIHIRDSI
jgi:hypothetical protein